MPALASCYHTQQPQPMPTLACRLIEVEYRQSKRSSIADRATHRPLRPGDTFYHHRVLERFPAWLAPNYRGRTRTDRPWRSSYRTRRSFSLMGCPMTTGAATTASVTRCAVTRHPYDQRANYGPSEWLEGLVARRRAGVGVGCRGAPPDQVRRSVAAVARSTIPRCHRPSGSSAFRHRHQGPRSLPWVNPCEIRTATARPCR